MTGHKWRKAPWTGHKGTGGPPADHKDMRVPPVDHKGRRGQPTDHKGDRGPLTGSIETRASLAQSAGPSSSTWVCIAGDSQEEGAVVWEGLKGDTTMKGEELLRRYILIRPGVCEGAGEEAGGDTRDSG